VSDKKTIDKHYSAMFESEVPRDLIFITILLAMGIATVSLPLLNETPLKYALPLPLLLFIPGYCLVAALFPEEGVIDLLERLGLSIGISVAIVILIGLGLNFTPWGIQLGPVIIFISLFTIIMILIAHYRRARVPVEKRLKIQVFTIAGDIRKEIFPEGENRSDRFLSWGLASVVTIAIITTAFVILAPQNGERFSEFYILSEKNTLSDYPDHIVPGKDYTLFIGVGNQEQRNVTYTIETWILQTESDPTNTSHILSMDPQQKMTVSLGYNENKVIPYTLRAKKAGYNREEFLLFNETVPGDKVTGSDRINASYRDLHLQIIVK
jgi:uncharacterized membrane protein